jgi:hypothetical protein
LLRSILALLLVLAAAPVALHAQVRIGPEFQVNTYTPGYQQFPDVAADAAGGFVVVWYSEGQDGSGTGVFARWHDASGMPLGGYETRVNAYTTSDQRLPQVASTPDGRVVVVWESIGQDGDVGGIFARQYASPAGLPGPELQVNAYTTSNQFSPAVAVDASGNFVVVWYSHNYLDDRSYVVGRRYDAQGQPRGGEFLVNTYTTGIQNAPRVASDAVGNFIVLWQSLHQDGDGVGVFAQRYDATGARVGGEFRVNTHTTGGQGSARVAFDAHGDFVVVWSGVGNGIVDHQVWGQSYDSTGVKRGAEFRVNVHTTGFSISPQVAMDPDGGFVVTWSSADTNSWGIFGRRYDALGNPEGGEFRVNRTVTGAQERSSVAVDARGDFVVVWQSPHDGSVRGVFGQRFQGDLILRDNFEDGTLGAWSSSVTDGGDLSVSILAGLNFTTAGMQGRVDDTAAIYVQDDRPDDEGRYRARFYFDPNGFDPGEGQNHFRTRIFIAFSEAPTRRVAAVVLRRLGGEYSIRIRARRDDGTRADTPFIPITDAPHAIEFDLRRASSPGGDDGYLEMYVDGGPVYLLSAYANSLAEVDFVRMGALSVKAGASGTMYWDEFESRRLSSIGP